MDHGLSCFRSSRFDIVPLFGVVTGGKSVACCQFQIWIVARLKPLGDVLCLIPIMILGIHFVNVRYLGTSYCSEV